MLQAAKCIDSSGRFVDDLSRATKIGTVYGVDWVDVPDRDARTVAGAQAVRATAPVTRARKLEGMWWADGGAYFVSSYAREESPGAAHDGQVWFYDPKRRTIRLNVLIGVNADPSVDGGYDGPDNITVSPYGGLVIAEDGSGLQHLFGATESGRTYPLARNELNIGTAEEPEYSRVHRRLLLPGRAHAVRQHPGPGHHAGHHRAVAARALTPRRASARRGRVRRPAPHVGSSARTSAREASAHSARRNSYASEGHSPSTRVSTRCRIASFASAADGRAGPAGGECLVHAFQGYGRALTATPGLRVASITRDGVRWLHVPAHLLRVPARPA